MLLFWLLVCFLLASSIRANVDKSYLFNSSDSQAPNITGETVLHFLESAISAMKGDENYRLGSEWRSDDGSLKSMEIRSKTRGKNRDIHALSVENCQSLHGFVDGSYSGTISYQYAYCSGCSYWNPLCSYQCSDVEMFACVYIEGNYDKVNLNYDVNSRGAMNTDVSLDPPSLGTTCTDCYAYVGANMGFLIDCDSTSCLIDFEAGGGAKFNIDLQINQPNLNVADKVFTPLTLPLSGAPANIPSSSYETLATFSSGYGTSISIDVATDLSLGYSGTGSASGSASLTAGFDASAYIEMSMERNWAFDFDMTGNFEINPPVLQSSLQVDSDASISFMLLQEVYWKVSFGFETPLGTPSVYARFSTPLTATYDYEFDISEASRRQLSTPCTNQQSLSLATTPDAFGMNIGLDYTTGFSRQYNTISSTSSSTCFASKSSGNDGGSTPSPTPAPVSAPSAPKLPTKAPTKMPSSSPTVSPTALPTNVPSHEPTASPTALPTNVPSHEPTASPTALPTNVPSHEPTASPTALPTNVPSHEPVLIVDLSLHQVIIRSRYDTLIMNLLKL